MYGRAGQGGRADRRPSPLPVRRPGGVMPCGQRAPAAELPGRLKGGADKRFQGIYVCVVHAHTCLSRTISPPSEAVEYKTSVK